MAFSPDAQLDITGGGSVPGQVAHIMRIEMLQECRLERSRLATRVRLISLVAFVKRAHAAHGGGTSIRQHRRIALGMNWLRAVASFRL